MPIRRAEGRQRADATTAWVVDGAVVAGLVGGGTRVDVLDVADVACLLVVEARGDEHPATIESNSAIRTTAMLGAPLRLSGSSRREPLTYPSRRVRTTERLVWPPTFAFRPKGPQWER